MLRVSDPGFTTTQVNNLTIVRDDLLDGGTKRRALVDWLPTLGTDHFIYAGSVYGSGGWALAEACRILGFRCTLALSRADYRPEWLNRIGCEIKWHNPQPVEHIYNLYEGTKGLLPLGFEDDGFKSCLVQIFRKLSFEPSEIWMSCVSGVLLNSAQMAWPDTKINAVCVARYHGDIGDAVKYQAPEKYHQAARELPPYPSNLFSDAKVWQFARQSALKDALIWNTSI